LAVTVKVNDLAFPGLAGIETCWFAVPLLHPTEVGRPTRAGETEKVQVVALCTPALRLTAPPEVPIEIGVAVNEVITRAGAADAGSAATPDTMKTTEAAPQSRAQVFGCFFKRFGLSRIAMD
jgi:hypothetical protein